MMPSGEQLRTKASLPAAQPLEKKSDWPIFSYHPELIYLDNAATTHSPRSVIDRQREFNEQQYAAVHRSVYQLAAGATQLFEQTRERVSQFIGARSAQEVIFTSNGTHALNLAAAMERPWLKPDDEIILSVAEHHSNILPWQRVARLTGARLVWLELDESQEFPLAGLYRLLTERTKLVGVAHVSNVLGYVAPLAAISAAAHRVGARVVADGAQAAGRMPVDVQALGVDYYAVTGHKLYGPTGTGWLYVRQEIIGEAEPMVVGGGTVEEVTRQGVKWLTGPQRFEAGTQPVTGIVGLGEAIEYLRRIKMDLVWQHDQKLAEELVGQLSSLAGVRLFGPKPGRERAAIVSFTVEASGKRLHSHDVAEVADSHHVAMRGGHHCAQVLMSQLGERELCRFSSGLYNTRQDITMGMRALVDAQLRLA